MELPALLSKHLKTVWCMLETFLFGGLHFGWASLVYIFKDEGYFSEDCATTHNSTLPNSESVACDYQDGQLALLYSVAMGLSAIPLFLCGTCISRFGYVKTRLIYIIVFAAGCALIIASSADQPWFASAGLALVAGGRVFYLTNVQISRLYKTGSFIIIAAMSGCYDSSAATTLFVKLAYDAGISRRISFGAIIIISVSTALLNTYVSFTGTDFGDVNNSQKSTEKNIKTADVVLKPSMKEIYKNYVFNKMFISHFSWFSLLMIHLMFFLTSSHIYIQQVVENVDNTTESSLTNFISIALMTGFVPAIVAGFFFELFQHRLKGGVYTRHLKTLSIGFIIVNLLSMAMALLSMFYILPLVSINFILLPVFRGFFFSSTYTYTVKLFPEKAFGVHSSLFDLQTCIILFIQTGIVRWIQSYEDAALHARLFNPFPKIRITFLVISVLAMYHPILTLMKIKRLQKMEKSKEVTIPFTKTPLEVGFEVKTGLPNEIQSEVKTEIEPSMTPVYGSIYNTTKT